MVNSVDILTDIGEGDIGLDAGDQHCKKDLTEVVLRRK